MTDIENGKFYDVTATGSAVWAPTKDGMKAEIPIKFANGETDNAIALIGSDQEKADKTRKALTDWGWDQARTWPPIGTPMRVVAKYKEYQGQQQRSCYVVGKGAASKPIEGDELDKFLKQERDKVQGVKTDDPFAT